MIGLVHRVLLKPQKTLFIDPEANAEGRRSESVKSEIKSESKDPLLVEDDRDALKAIHL